MQPEELLAKAAGPLVKWAAAQVAYAKQLLKVEPLNNELRKLEEESVVMREQQDALQVLVAELEETIKQYEAEYAVWVRRKAWDEAHPELPPCAGKPPLNP